MAKPNDQPMLFGDMEQYSSWHDDWQGMPEFVHEDLSPHRSLIVHFASPDDARKFSKLIGQKLTDKTQSVWYPEAEIGRIAGVRYSANEP